MWCVLHPATVPGTVHSAGYHKCFECHTSNRAPLGVGALKDEWGETRGGWERSMRSTRGSQCNCSEPFATGLETLSELIR